MKSSLPMPERQEEPPGSRPRPAVRTTRMALYPREAGVVYQEAEGREPHHALADVLVPVHPAPERLLRVVEVEGEHVAEADGRVELRHGPVVAVLGGDVITGGEHVARVHAGAGAPAAAGRQARPQLGHLLEPPAQGRALAGRGLDQQPGLPGHGLQGALHGLDHQPGPLRRVLVAPGVKDEGGDPQLLAAAELLGERRPALLADLPVGGGAVDEIRGVGGHGLAGPPGLPPEPGHLLLVQGTRRPAPGVAGEDLDAIGPVLLRSREGLRDSTADGFVGAEEHGRGVAIQ